MIRKTLVHLIVIIALVHALPAFAERSNETPAKRFLPYIGQWTVTEPNDSLLLGTDFSFTTFDRGTVDLSSEGTGIVSGKFRELPAAVNGKRRRFKAIYDDIFGDATASIGVSGRVKFEVPPGNTFQSLLITFIPHDPERKRVTVRAERIGDVANNGRTIVHKFKRRGVGKPGKTLRFDFDVINRGSSLLQKGELLSVFIIDGPVEDLKIRKTKRMSECGVVSIIGIPSIACKANYLGAPLKKKKGMSVANVKFHFNIKEDTDVEQFNILATSGEASGDNDLDITSINRTAVVKIKQTDSSGGLNGLFTRTFPSFAPPKTSTYRFKKQNGVIVGILVAAASAEAQYKLGTLIYKDLRSVGGSFKGKIAHRIQGGKIIYVDITLTPSGNTFVNRFGQVMLTKK